MGSGKRGFRGGEGEETGGFHGGAIRLEEEESFSACFCGLSYHRQFVFCVLVCTEWMMEKKRRVKIFKIRGDCIYLFYLKRPLNFSFTSKL
jgi:hypothetical protein